MFEGFEGIHVFDDVIDESYQDQIRTTLLSSAFPWYFLSDVSFQYSSEPRSHERPAYCHNFVMQRGRLNSGHHEMLLGLLEASSARISYRFGEILKGRAFLQLPLNEAFAGPGLDTPHTDQLFDHLAILYYVVDSDGDTIIYGKKHEPDVEAVLTDADIVRRISPRQGRVVLFNGLQYHTAEQPRDHVRCVVNYNVL